MLLCANCNTELFGEYCHACGQKKIRMEELSARHLISEVADEISSFRTKFKTVQSLWRLPQPGYLTNEFLIGKRQRYLHPLKVYLVCAAIFFFAAPWAGFNLTSLMQEDDSGELKQLVSAQEVERSIDPAVFSQRFDLRVRTVYTVALGVGVVVFAFLLQLLFLKNALPFGSHIIFALHYFSFLYLLTLFAGLLRRLDLTSSTAAALAVCIIVPYLILALKFVYKEKLFAIVLKAAVLLLLTAVINFFASTLSIQLTLKIV
jgi:hypothetical protein